MKVQIHTKTKRLLADILTPVSIYLKIRDEFPNSILLESSDYHGNENSYSYIAMQPCGEFKVETKGKIKQLTVKYPEQETQTRYLQTNENVTELLQEYIQNYHVNDDTQLVKVNGVFGYISYDAVQYFENIEFESPLKQESDLPEISFSFYKYIVAINHFKNELHLLENLIDNEESKLEMIESILIHKSFATYKFESTGEEQSNVTDDEYKYMVTKGKEHCKRGDVFQIVLSRQFSQTFKGDDFNVYRNLRSINPSPYLFYFDYGSYKIFGSSPESQIVVKSGKATINPIAGTFRRTGDDKKDKELAEKLMLDPKENAEHVMLVDLARNDLSRNSSHVVVETYRDVQYFSHVIHLVSKVTGDIKPETNAIKLMGDCFPAGTLSGAPKHKAMQLIDKYENQRRGCYGGSIGYLGFNGDVVQAITIRTFLSKNNVLYYQAGAGIVLASNEESELNEVNNKLAALKKAVDMAKEV